MIFTQSVLKTGPQLRTAFETTEYRKRYDKADRENNPLSDWISGWVEHSRGLFVLAEFRGFWASDGSREAKNVKLKWQRHEGTLKFEGVTRVTRWMCTEFESI